MLKIPLSQGLFATIDDEDAERVTANKWSAVKSSIPGFHYAFRNVQRAGKTSKIYLHRFIAEPPPDLVVDHINGDPLDNRRSNLRVCTRTQNLANRRGVAGASSSYKGVRWFKRDGCWAASIKRDWQAYHLGYFDSEIEAAKAYDKAAREVFGEFARTNFPG